MSVPRRENKIEGIWLPKKDKSFRRETGRCWADRKMRTGRAARGPGKEPGHMKFRQGCCQLEVQE